MSPAIPFMFDCKCLLSSFSSSCNGFDIDKADERVESLDIWLAIHLSFCSFHKIAWKTLSAWQRNGIYFLWLSQFIIYLLQAETCNQLPYWKSIKKEAVTIVDGKLRWKLAFEWSFIWILPSATAICHVKLKRIAEKRISSEKESLYWFIPGRDIMCVQFLGRCKIFMWWIIFQ